MISLHPQWTFNLPPSQRQFLRDDKSSCDSFNLYENIEFCYGREWQVLRNSLHPQCTFNLPLPQRELLRWTVFRFSSNRNCNSVLPLEGFPKILKSSDSWCKFNSSVMEWTVVRLSCNLKRNWNSVLPLQGFPRSCKSSGSSCIIN